MNQEKMLEQLLMRADEVAHAPSTEFMDVDDPGIPGADNRWFPSQGQARKAALLTATRLGPGYRIVHDPTPSRGQPHYHVVNPQNRRVSGHFFYGRRMPRKVLRAKRGREREAQFEQWMQAVDRETEQFLPGAARRFWAAWQRQLQIAKRMFQEQRYGCWCGPGNVCTTVTDKIDACCKRHDEAYARAGVTSGSGPSVNIWTVEGLKRTRAADLELVRCTQATLWDWHWYGPAAHAYRTGIAFIFGARAAAASAAIAAGL